MRRWSDTGFFIIIDRSAIGRSYRPHVHTALYSTQMFQRLSDKRGELASPFSPVLRDAVSHLHLLLGSGNLRVCRRQPHLIPRRTLVGSKSLYRPHALSDCLEYHLELPCNHILVHMDRYPP